MSFEKCLRACILKRTVPLLSGPRYPYSDGASLVSWRQTRNAMFWNSSKVTDWNKAVSEAERVVGYPTSFMSLRCLLSDELSNVAMEMRKLIGTKHPLLKMARKFLYDGKHAIQTKGLLVLLMSKAAGPSENEAVLETMNSGIYPRQRSLAEIIEMINTANLIHKGVVNLVELQPSDGSVEDMHFGNKMSVLSGDFLLANASTGLAELGNTHVVELISSAIGDLVEAEFVGPRDKFGHPLLLSGQVSIDDWERQAFLSSGSLLAKSCKAAMMLARHDEVKQEMAYAFGKHTALAHQLKEELQPYIDYTDSSVTASIQGAPTILYVNSRPEKAKQLGFINNPNIDTKLLRKVVKNSGTVEQTKHMLQTHGQKALAALSTFTPSDARSALEKIVNVIMAV